jgi:hypothetical protein
MNNEEKGKMNITDISDVFRNPGPKINNFVESDYGKYVITGMQAEPSNVNTRIGKLLQVRLEDGIYGSDCVFLRHLDGSLIPHENQAFFRVRDEYIDFMDSIYNEMYSKYDEESIDSIQTSYTKSGFKEPEIGFIIPSKFSADDHTPMRLIKASIASKINGITEVNINF